MTVVREFRAADLSSIRNVVKRCEPLGCHTLYTYWVLSRYFHSYFLILEEGSEIVGFINGLSGQIAGEESVGFIWQIGVVNEYRGKGYSKKLVSEFVRRCRENGINKVQVTIDESNVASTKLFQFIATKVGDGLHRIGGIELFDQFMSEQESEVIYEFSLTSKQSISSI